MILVDTNVLVALVDERDPLHAKAARDLRKLEGPFAVASAVLVESCFLMEQSYLRRRLRHVLERLPIHGLELAATDWAGVFDWLEKYADHTPDLCDAILVAMAGRERASIWTYDVEFRKLWRTKDGKALRLVGSRLQR